MLLDEHDERVWPYFEPDGLDAGRGFTPIHCRPGFDMAGMDLIETGVDGSDLVVRTTTTHEELLRPPALHQVVGTAVIKVDGFALTKVEYRVPSTDTSVRGITTPIGHRQPPSQREISHGGASIDTFRVEQVPLTLAGALHFPHMVQEAAEACLDTSNPVVVTHT